VLQDFNVERMAGGVMDVFSSAKQIVNRKS
jgi:hypothetical protein